MNLRHAVQRSVDYAGEHGDRVIAAVGALLLLTYLSASIAFPKKNGQIVVGDAKHHYVQLRSIVFDRDLDFRNEYLAWSPVPTPVEDWPAWDLTPTGHVRNYMPVGPALLWLPGYVALVFVEQVAAWLGLGPAPTGYERSLQLVPGVVGVLASMGAAMLSWRMSARVVDRRSAVWGVLAVWLGSHALYYALVSPAYSHAASMLASAAFCFVWLKPKVPFSITRSALLGALAGFAALMRWQDAIFLLVPLWESLRSPGTAGTRLAGIAAACAGWLAMFAPQMVVWQVLYGQLFALPQGGSFMQWTAPHLWDVLFSTARGLFAWAPLLVPAALGLGSLLVGGRLLGSDPKWSDPKGSDPRWSDPKGSDPRWPLVAVLLLTWYVNAAVADWWAGEAFGARRFLSLFPLFALGLATWLSGPTPAAAGDGRPSRMLAPRLGRLAAVAALVIANALLLLQYQLALKGLAISPYPADVFDMWLARFVVPFRLIGWGG